MSDAQLQKLIDALSLSTQIVAGALGGIEEALRAKQPPPSSRPSSGKQKVGK